MWPFSRRAREERREEKREWRLADRRERDAHEALLIKAAGIGEASLICHTDTWWFIVQRCSTGERMEHFSPPGGDVTVADEDGKVTVPLSGRTLAAVLDQMSDDAEPGTTPTVEQAVATTVRDAITKALEVDDDRMPVIIIDSRPLPAAAEEEQQE